MSICELNAIRRDTSVITARSMADVASRNAFVWLLISIRSRSSGESAGPNSPPISAVHESSEALRPTSVAMPTRSSTYPG